jgi:hypothetical protein
MVKFRGVVAGSDRMVHDVASGSEGDVLRRREQTRG